MDLPVNFRLPLEIINEADKCQKGHACLTDPHYKLREVNFQHQKAHTGILTCEYGSGCPYNSHIGTEHVCTCPVRQEIFKKYQI